MKITADSLAVFLSYYRDAANWSGQPLVGGNVGGSKEERGNLTQLKRAGLITTSKSDGETWVSFTPAGVALGMMHTGRDEFGGVPVSEMEKDAAALGSVSTPAPAETPAVEPWPPTVESVAHELAAVYALKADADETAARLRAAIEAGKQARRARADRIIVAVHANARRVSALALPIVLAVVAMVSTACTSGTTEPVAARSLAGQWQGHAAPFASLRLVLGTNADGSTYGTAYATLAECHSDRAADCSFHGDVTSDAPAAGSDAVALTISFPAYSFAATFTGRALGNDVLAGSITERLTTSAAVSVPAAITFARSN